jgi:hypothetical protein
MALALALLLASATLATAFLPPQNPPWPPRYLMNQSTLTMACNSSGPYDPVLAASFGVVSFDWSQRKAQWAAAKPMTCEEELMLQGQAVQAVGTDAKIFSYFNLVKALPWYTSVREKLEDPAYAGFFLRFAPGVTTHVPRCDAVNASLCSDFYHDQLQTPAVPTPANPSPDGSCVGICDCGEHTPW